jgi:hypothetical protein
VIPTDLSEILNDSEFWQPYTVYRKTGTYSAGRLIETEQPLSFGGPVMPASGKEIQQTPDADRVTSMTKFYSPGQQIFVTHKNDGSGNTGTSDEICYRGDRYRVSQVNPWISSSGDQWFIAFAVYMQGD